MKILDDMKACYGCGACYNACPTGAISMTANAEGFLEPTIDEEKCISCGKCRQVCPSVSCQYSNESEPDIYAFAAEEKVLYNSSSGGIFTFLAEHILRAGGYVAGAAYDSRFLVEHVIIHSLEELDRIRRSKYLQSSTGNTYKQTRELLEKGSYVLYSGTPCQIAGLLRFLRKSYDNLFTVDVLCHGVPSPKLFQEHLSNSYSGIENVADVEFRSREGWASLFKVKQLGGESKTLYNHNSVYMQAFLQNINLRASCFQCEYSCLPRQGDVTIGDLWAAGNANLSFDYRKGVSIILLNSEKGKRLFQDVLSKTEYNYHIQKMQGEGVEKPCNRSVLNDNIFHPSTQNSDATKRQSFFDDCATMGFEKAVYASLHKFDVGLMLYMSNNYGSIATNYALYKIIGDMGKKVAVLDHMVPVYDGEATVFARKHMNLCSTFMVKDDRRAANQCFETFVVGSDMSWNWVGRPMDRFLQFWMLGFADDSKRVISYAPSFGGRRGKTDIDKDMRVLCTYYLKRFDAISVREDCGVDICRDLFGIQAKQVLDPVLLCRGKVWDELSAMSQVKFEEKYLLAYILDPTPQKRQLILEAAKNMNKELVVILDLGMNVEANKKAMNLDDKLIKPGFIDWLAYFQHADYIITDSFHGACFSILYRKKFVAIKNRSKERFDSLARLIDCPFLFFEDSKLPLGKTNIFADINYDSVYECVESKRIESGNWLRSALDVEVKPKGGNDSTELILQLLKPLRERTDLLKMMKKKYAYEEEQKEVLNSQLKAGKTWFEAICARNNVTPADSELRSIHNMQEYFSFLKAKSHYVIVLSGADDCSFYWNRFIELSGLPLRRDVFWRNSYMAVIEGGEVRIDEKSKEELNNEFTFVVGHPNCNVEYKNGHLTVDCMAMKYAGVRVKSKGYSGPMGAFKSEIVVGNIDYSMNKTGINMVIIDKETAEVIDSVNVNTYNDSELKINRR